MNPKTLWIGPIQGGIHRDFLILSAQEMSKRSFSIYGLGSPTPIMERYIFDTLLEMIISVKQVIPLSKPLHLFGAGHPMLFPLIVAFGVDTFDSAAYALYAKNGRYITSEGSMKLSELEYFPCSCSQCSRYDPQELKNLNQYERIKVLSEHNLWICFQEIRRIKEAISEGRLWELVHARSLQHPMLHTAFKTMKKFCIDIERLSPVTKRKGLFTFNYLDSYRPEVVRHIQRFFRRCTSEKTKFIVFCPYFPNIRGDIVNRLKKITNECRRQQIRLIYYGYPYGIIPVELDDVYPLGQTTLSLPLDGESREFVSKNIKKYLRKIEIGELIFIFEPSIVTDDVIEYLKTISNVKILNLRLPNLLYNFKNMIKSNFQDER